jgi:hypothetical protein
LWTQVFSSRSVAIQFESKIRSVGLETERKCEWDGSQLILRADNDFDESGLALRDEFSDAISACIRDGFDGDIIIVSVAPLPD